MRILHVADLHLQHAWFDWVASHCAEFDLLVIAGDLQNAFSNVPIHDQARAIEQWLLSLATPTVVCSGDLDFWLARHGVTDPDCEAAWLRRLRETGMIIGVDGSTFSFQGLNHAEAWLKIAVKGWEWTPDLRERNDILVTHCPPAGCPCAFTLGRNIGDPNIWKAVRSHPPRLMLCGHVHQPRHLWCRCPRGSEETLVLVPGCDEEAEVPAHWIIDTGSGIASHSSGQTAVFESHD